MVIGHRSGFHTTQTKRFAYKLKFLLSDSFRNRNGIKVIIRDCGFVFLNWLKMILKFKKKYSLIFELWLAKESSVCVVTRHQHQYVHSIHMETAYCVIGFRAWNFN